MDKPVEPSMPRSISAVNPSPSFPHPGDSRRIVAELETAAVRIEEMVYSHGLCIARHSHDSANLIFIIAGVHWSGYSRGGDICLPQTVRFLAAGEAHENYFPVESRCLHIELRQSILDLASEYGTTICAPGQVTRAGSTALGRQLYREFRHKDSDSLLEIEGAILHLLLADEKDGMRSEPIPRWLLQIREMLHEDPNSRRSLIDLSRHVGRHPVQISRQFHQRFGCTLGEYMRRIRIARAQSLLSCTDLKISDIALASGFCDQSHFTTIFRRVTGMPPRRYRLLISRKRPPGSPFCWR
jgi:AraC family transcriptional regulator